jgi:hypothetical protein
MALGEMWRTKVIIQSISLPEAGRYQNHFDYLVVHQGALLAGFTDFVDQFTTVIQNQMLLCMSDDVQIVEWRCLRLDPPQIETERVVTQGQPGLINKPTAPFGVAVQINRSTLAKGPRGNGKLFLTGFPSDNLSEDNLTPAYKAIVEGLALNLPVQLVGVNGWTFNPHINHYNKATKRWEDAGNVEFTETKSVTTTLISRRGGRGS